MKKTLLAFATAVLFGLAGCGDDESSTPSTPVNSTIEVSSSAALPGDFGVGEDLEFTIVMTSDPSVGIASLVITNNGQELVNETSFTANQVTFRYPYTTEWNDAQSGSASFTMTMTDGSGRTATASATVNVSVEYGYFNDNLIPIPGWSLVDNDVANPVDDSTNVDLSRETIFGGDSRYFTLSSTEYYQLSSGTLDLLDPNLTTAQIEAAISGSSPVSEVFDSGGTGFPFVAKLRGTNEYALISQIDTTFNPVRLGYRKTSASAGQ